MSDLQVDRGKLASAKGFANENRLLAALLGRGYNASQVDLPHSTYDLVVEKSATDFIRIQVKTVGKSGSISFTGGSRGGVDREYKSNVKTYVQNTQTSDIVVGVESRQANGDRDINFYFVPTLFIEKIRQKSISINRIQHVVKNKWEVLDNCKDTDFVEDRFKSVLRWSLFA